MKNSRPKKTKQRQKAYDDVRKKLEAYVDLEIALIRCEQLGLFKKSALQKFMERQK